MQAPPGNLAEWLDFISLQHSSEIELGLDRLKQVAGRVGLKPFPCPSITVAGTNGKGSSITTLERLYLSAGYKTACYTSPHLTVFNERIRINGDFVSDDDLCRAFAKINSSRKDVPLTYFEFATLAALYLFQQGEFDILLLEVGLGGRLDATNLFPADIALITSISIDHVGWLGDNREDIGREKAGIIHEGRTVVVSDPEPPKSLLSIAGEKAGNIFLLNREFQYQIHKDRWSWQYDEEGLPDIPLPALVGDAQFNNLAGVLMCVRVLQQSLPIADQLIVSTLPEIRINGRFQVIDARPGIILDVSHNPASMALLSDNLEAMPVAGKTHAVVAMLKDKDIYRSLQNIHSSIDSWYVAGLRAARGESAEKLKAVLQKIDSNSDVHSFESIELAWKGACSMADEEDQVVVFGSFHTVGGIISHLSSGS